MSIRLLMSLSTSGLFKMPAPLNLTFEESPGLLLLGTSSEVGLPETAGPLVSACFLAFVAGFEMVTVRGSSNTTVNEYLTGVRCGVVEKLREIAVCWSTLWLEAAFFLTGCAESPDGDRMLYFHGEFSTNQINRVRRS